MKNLLALLALGCMSLLITGCYAIDGDLNVVQPFKVIASDYNKCDGDPDPNCDPDDHLITLSPDHYPVSFEFKSKNKAVIAMNLNGKKANLVLQIPKGKTFPDNGGIRLSAKESGQPFDLLAEIKTIVTKSEPRRDYERCTVQWYETVCHNRYEPFRDCWTVVHSRPGERYVEYYYRTTDRTMAVNLTNPKQPADVAAQFYGQRQETEIVHTYESACR